MYERILRYSIDVERRSVPKAQAEKCPRSLAGPGAMCGVIQYNGRGRHCHVCARPSISLCSACWGLAAARAVRCAALRVAPAGTRRRAGASRAAALIVGRSSPHTRRSFIGAALIGHSLPRLECHYKYKPRFERHYKMSRIYNGFRLSIRPVSLLSQELYGHSNCGGAGRRRGEGRDREITDCLLTRKYRSAATTNRNFADLSPAKSRQQRRSSPCHTRCLHRVLNR